jgi:hypothetical protein
LDTRSRDLAEKLDLGARKAADFFRAIPVEGWQLVLYTDGAHWNTGQVLLHLVDAERSIFGLMKSVLKGGEGVPAGFDLDAYNDEVVPAAAAFEPEGVIEEFLSQRKALVAWVSNLQPGELDTVGRHPFLGMSSIAEMVRLMVMHVQLHQRDIRKALRENNL